MKSKSQMNSRDKIRLKKLKMKRVRNPSLKKIELMMLV